MQAFYTANATTGIGLLAKTDFALTQHNPTAAAASNIFTPANNFEAKMQQVNAVAIKMADTTGTTPVNAADITTLKTIANSCPETNGRAFYKARNLLNIFYGQALHYTSHCSSGNHYRLAQTNTGINATSAQNLANVNLYPNPNSGSFTLTYNIKEDAALTIYDMQGKQVFNLPLAAEQTNVIINNLDLQNGAYMYKVLNNGTMLSSGKLIILK